MKMRYGKHPIKIVALTVCVLALSWTQAAAVFDPWADHKMHYPQLPDPFGWDVQIASIEGAGLASERVVADDWMCTRTGAVRNIHFWGSWVDDVPAIITHVTVSIWSDNPVGPMGWSEPDAYLWGRYFTPSEFEIYPVGGGQQGYYWPVEGIYQEIDHFQYYQVDITDIPDPFIQEQGTTYWLGLGVYTEPGWPYFGWKTSLDHWNDDAVYFTWDSLEGSRWWELRDPVTEESLDMAFVITPEPATLVLMGLGLVLVGLKKGKKAGSA